MDEAKSFQLIGQIAVVWNKLENDFKRFLYLYIDTDRATVDAIVHPYRAVDRERLLSRLVAVNESDANIRCEIGHVISCCEAFRKSRNVLLHNAGSEGGALSIKGGLKAQALLEALIAFDLYINELIAIISVIVLDRQDRATPDEDMSGPDELRPLPVFEAPKRVEKPVAIKTEDLSE